MARKHKRRPPHANEAPTDGPSAVARRRARKLCAQGNYRKAALALREWVRETDAPSAWVAFGAMLAKARRTPQALDALHQGLWRYRRSGQIGRARAVASVILRLDPMDRPAGRVLASAA